MATVKVNSVPATPWSGLTVACAVSGSTTVGVVLVVDPGALVEVVLDGFDVVVVDRVDGVVPGFPPPHEAATTNNAAIAVIPRHFSAIPLRLTPLELLAQGR
jgi:hypothetical protein